MSTVMPISEARLRELAAEPKQDLFPVLNSGPAFAPWIVLLAFLAPLAGVMKWSLDERSAEWGLQALAGSQPVIEVDAAGQETFTASPFAGVPPLSGWLAKLTLSHGKIELPWGLMGISYLAAAGTILIAARLGKRFGMPRLASLTAVCCAGSPLLLNSAHVGSPEVLGLCLMTFSMERFLAHLDSSVGVWSTRLLVSALAWGGSWLTIGWPALSLGVVLALQALLFWSREARVAAGGELRSMQKFRSSLFLWWLIGFPIGLSSIWPTFWSLGPVAAMSWLFSTVPHPASPLFPDATAMLAWGGSVGLTFLLGWMVLGAATLIQRPAGMSTTSDDGRPMLPLLWWGTFTICRLLTAAWGIDPTPWDVWQTVPACLMAAIGMEAVIERKISSEWLGCALVVGIVSVIWHVSLVQSRDIYLAVAGAAMVAALPILRNLWENRSTDWNERQCRRALRGLILSTWLAHVGWGVAQSVPDSRLDVQLANQLRRVSQLVTEPGAIIVVAPTAPARTLIFQLRNQWPDVPMIQGDRWESAISRTLSSVDNWADSEFLVVELSQRESQFRRPGSGWIVTTVGEPRRYRGDQLSLHRVSIHSP